MNDKQYKALRDEIDGYIIKWAKILGMGRVTISMKYNRSLCEDDNRTTAICFAGWEYNSCTIEVYVPAFAELSAELREETIIHELLHYVMNPLHPDREKASDSEAILVEKVVSDVAYSLVVAYREGANSQQ